MNENILFSTGRLSDYLQSCTERIRSQIGSFSDKEISDPNFVLQISQLASSSILKIPVLDENNIKWDEVQIEVPADPYITLGISTTKKAQKLILFVPFHGESALFNFQPLEFSYNPPIGKIVYKDILLEYIVSYNMPEEEIKRTYPQAILKIKEWLKNVEKQVGVYNNSVGNVINEAVANRREKIAKDKKRDDDFGLKRKNQ